MSNRQGHAYGTQSAIAIAPSTPSAVIVKRLRPKKRGQIASHERTCARTSGGAVK